MEANGRRLRNYLDWEAVKLDLHVGDAVDVSVRNGSTTGRRRIVTGDLPTVSAEKITVLQDLQLVNVTPAIQAERGIRSDRGALIFRISPQVSRATGLQSGDVIVGVNRSPVRSASEVSDLLNVRPGRSSGSTSSATVRSPSPIWSSDERRPLALAARLPLRVTRHADAVG